MVLGNLLRKLFLRVFHHHIGVIKKEELYDFDVTTFASCVQRSTNVRGVEVYINLVGKHKKSDLVEELE